MKTHRVLRSKAALVRDLYRYHKLPYYAQVLGEADSWTARQMLAKRYQAKKMIDASHLNSKGVMHHELDPYWQSATYFGVKDHNSSRLHTTGRFIYADPQKGIDSLHMSFEGIDIMWQHWLLHEVDPARIVELASLVKADGNTPSITTLYLFREMLRFSQTHDIDYWVFGLTASLQKSFEARFGNTMEQIGGQVFVGPLRTPCIPYILRVNEARARFRLPHGSLLQRLGAAQIEKFMFEEYAEQELAAVPTPWLAR